MATEVRATDDGPMGWLPFQLAHGELYKKTLPATYVAGVALAIAARLDRWWGIAIVLGLTGLTAALLYVSRRHRKRRDTWFWDDEELYVVSWMPAMVAGMYIGYEASDGEWGWTAGVGLGAGFIAGMTAVALRDSRQASGGFINWHIVPYRWRGGRPLSRWSPELLRSKVVRTWAGHSGGGDDWESYYAVLLFHQDPEVLPASLVRRARARGDFKPWIVLRYFADDHNLMGAAYGVLEPMLDSSWGFDDPASAEEAAVDAARELGAKRCDWVDVPGLIRASFVRDMRGR